ncbi:MAG: efflux RND transporter permease subunit [Desulfobacteraceae bacterium]|nr:efflux RND transporter permease subunit [Desulfobacteraceae bacterium]
MNPDIDGAIVVANAEFPNGTPHDVTERAVKQIGEALMRLAERRETRSGDPLVIDRMAITGASMGDEMPETGAHLGGMLVTLLESEKRGIHSKDIMVEWEKEIGAIPGIKSLTFKGMAQGPEGAPVEIWLQGHHQYSGRACAAYHGNRFSGKVSYSDGCFNCCRGGVCNCSDPCSDSQSAGDTERFPPCCPLAVPRVCSHA